MAGYVLIGTLAAFGLLCVMWIIYGFFLPKAAGGMVVCTGHFDEQTLVFIRRCIWLREMGLLQCPLLALEEGLDSGQRIWLISHGIELCSRAALPKRLGIEENGIDTGIGDSAGRHQRCGVSEL